MPATDLFTPPAIAAPRAIGVHHFARSKRLPALLVIAVVFVISLAAGVSPLDQSSWAQERRATARRAHRRAKPKGGTMNLKMPGESFKGPLPELSEPQRKLRDMLKRDVEKLAGEIGERNIPRRHRKLIEAEKFVEQELQSAGYEVLLQRLDAKGRECHNIEAELSGKEQKDEIIVVGAHLDSVPGAPGANDNGSGVAATLALARRFAGLPAARTIRFVVFANEEMPYFQSDAMGSLAYAKRCRERHEKIVAMLSLETIGYYSDAPDSQKYPLPFSLFYPSTGNFIAFVANTQSATLVERIIKSFREHVQFPSEGAAIPGEMEGAGWSDHWSFWQAGYPAVMVTDTAPFRYPHYHLASDTPDKLDYDRMARVVDGLESAIRELASPHPDKDARR